MLHASDCDTKIVRQPEKETSELVSKEEEAQKKKTFSERGKVSPIHERVWSAEHASCQFSQALHQSMGPLQRPGGSTWENCSKIKWMTRRRQGCIYQQDDEKIHSCRVKSFHLLLKPGHVWGICLSCYWICLVEHWQEGRDKESGDQDATFFSINVIHLVEGFLCWEGHLLHLLYLNLEKASQYPMKSNVKTPRWKYGVHNLHLKNMGYEKIWNLTRLRLAEFQIFP